MSTDILRKYNLCSDWVAVGDYSSTWVKGPGVWPQSAAEAQLRAAADGDDLRQLAQALVVVVLVVIVVVVGVVVVVAVSSRRCSK